ncbi:UPF0524 protein C3orf70 homolog B-like [Sciurus carolinensis]|uniref:UPF0524 protein C3orf70 homolog B-like n=1 Tax=Sciurus carolinensis TaxID=30640 RepID=UPI001FB5650A|nr:UPF0524 protein C3orf70 homolog B-like [Sciurus carolinensis]
MHVRVHPALHSIHPDAASWGSLLSWLPAKRQNECGRVDEAQALARSRAPRRPDFQPCDGLSICATHSHGKCFKLHWCCHLGWCHCRVRRSGGASAEWTASGGEAAFPGRRCEKRLTFFLTWLSD